MPVSNKNLTATVTRYLAGTSHLQSMAQQAKACDIGAGRGPMLHQYLGSSFTGLPHLFQCPCVQQGCPPNVT